MTTKSLRMRRWLFGLMVLIVLIGGVVGYQYWYHNIRQTDESRSLRFMVLCGNHDYVAAERYIERNPRIMIHGLGLFGGNLLHASAVSFARTEPLQILLAHGAEVNGLDELGRTPLDCAIENGNDVASDYLIAHGGMASASVKTVSTQDLVDRLRKEGVQVSNERGANGPR